MKSLTEFGERVVTLNTGAQGLRGGLKCTVKEVTGEAAVMDFIGSDNSIDRYNEVIQQDGWQLDAFKANPVIPDCHDYSSISKILGRAQSVGVADGKLVNRVEFCTDNPMGNLAYKMTKGGFIKSQSVGFIPLEWENGKGNDQPDRTYLKQELLEISLVVVPANPGATIGLALKSGAVEKADVKDVIEFLQRSVGMLKAGVKVGDMVTLDPEYKQNQEKPWSECRGQVGKVTYVAQGFGVCFVKFPMVEDPVAFRVECLLPASEKQICGEKAGPGTSAGASGAGAFDAQAQQLMASLKSVFKGL